MSWNGLAKLPNTGTEKMLRIEREQEESPLIFSASTKRSYTRVLGHSGSPSPGTQRQREPRPSFPGKGKTFTFAV